MTFPTPVNDNRDGLEEAPASFYALESLPTRMRRAEPGRVEGIVTAAVLAATAFRLRDEDGLVLSLRRLTDAVAAFDAEQDAA
ncbi:MAG: hypothetical protein KDG89_13195 [Geminicoccaceae bacterium]|nr:hypothetical protein [Geminicoccaceae bacterium]